MSDHLPKDPDESYRAGADMRAETLAQIAAYARA